MDHAPSRTAGGDSGIGRTAPPVEDLPAAKSAARAAVRAARRTRKELAADDPARRVEAQAVAEAVLARLPILLAERGDDLARMTVASYESLPSEPPTDLLNTDLLRRGVRVLVPVLLPDKDLDWAALTTDGTTPPRPGTPLGPTAIRDAALVVVPALRIDREGYRLGQGGGSYDRALTRVDPAATIVAVVDADGLVDGVPREEHDARVHAVVRVGRPWTDLPLDPGSGPTPCTGSGPGAGVPAEPQR